MYQFSATSAILLLIFLLSSWTTALQPAPTPTSVIQPISEVNNNFLRDFVTGLGVAAGCTIAALVLICTGALCGPSLLRRCCGCGSSSSRRADNDDSQQWLGTGRKAEKQPEPPFVQSSRSLIPAYA